MPSHTHKTLILLALVGCFSYGTSKAQERTPPDTSRPYVILPYDTTDYWMFSQNMALASRFQPTELSEDEIDSCYRLMQLQVNEYNTSNQALNLKGYYFQYVAVRAPNGKRLVYINAICKGGAENLIRVDKELDWKKRLILVDDGGPCYFQLKMNFDEKRVLQFSVNGPR